MTEILQVVLGASLGAAAASVLACVPGLHVYNVMGAAGMFAYWLGRHGAAVPAVAVMSVAVGMVVGYAVLNTIPSVLLAAPDESALFTVLPGQKYLALGRGREAVILTSVGGLAALIVLVLVFGPLAPRLVPAAHNVLRPHAHWILWCVICFMLMSEWPREGRLGQGGWHKFLDGWRSTGAGLLTFLLSGLLGFIILYRPPVSSTVAFQNLMPAFVGLFTLPWLIVNLVTGTGIPPQQKTSPDLPMDRAAHGVLAGCLGGGFAAFFPVVTGGVGGFLAGHAAAVRDDRTFLVSQGASKVVYYVGGLLLFFVPGIHLTRGGAAWMLRGLAAPAAYRDYDAALAAVAVAGVVTMALLFPLANGTLRLIAAGGYRRASALALAVVVAIVCAVTGLSGAAVMLVAAGIGIVPVLFGSRRMNCLGVILLPMACNMSGFGADVASFLRLL